MARKYFPPKGSSFFCLLAFPLLLSCASARPLQSEPSAAGPSAGEGPVAPFNPAILKAPAVRAPSPGEARVAWLFFAPGVEYGKGSIRRPRLSYHALKIDLGQEGLSIVINGPASRSGTVPATRVSSFVKNYGLIAGINTVPFSPVSAKEGEERTIAGLVIAGGELLSPPRPEYDALVFYTRGGAAIVNQGELGELRDIYAALGGFHSVLENAVLPERLRGAALARPEDSGPRHPRSAAGLSPDGQTLYLLVIDGRRPGSAGATEAETGLILKALGAAWGLNFDGGGSSALALGFSDTQVRTVNIPVHSGIPGRERAVASCLGIRLTRR